MKKRLVLFDFDDTLTKRDSLFDFIRLSFPFLKKLSTGLIFIPTIFMSLLGLNYKDKTKEELLSYLLQSLSEEEIKTLGINLIDNLDYKISILNKLKSHAKSGDEVVVVSASPDIWITPFSEKFNIKSISTKWDFKNNKFSGLNCNNEEKVNRIKMEYKIDEYDQIIVFGNSTGDKPMMNLADVKNWV